MKSGHANVNGIVVTGMWMTAIVDTLLLSHLSLLLVLLQPMVLQNC
jgi:hypothetical protein